jgi:carbamoyl-phosphate synthase large subunit
MVSILITGMGSTTAISVIKGLRKQHEISIRIIGVDINAENTIAGSAFCDKFYTVPPAIEEKYIPEILRICELEKVEILFPIVDIELEVIAKNIGDFQNRGIQVWLSNLYTIQICNDKYRTYQFFKENQFPTPQSWLPEEVADRKESMNYPLIVKPRRGVGSIDVFRVENVSELNKALACVKQPILQECLAGEEFTIDVVSDHESHVLAAVPRKRIHVKAGISYKALTVEDESLIKQATKIAQCLKIVGHSNIQCMAKGGEAYFFEVNPRFSAALPLTIASGVNSPLLLVKLSLGERLRRDDLKFQAGVYMARYWEEIFYYEPAH